MKYFSIIAFLLISSVSFSQDAQFQKIEKLMGKQDLSQLELLIDQNIVICINEIEKNYSKAEASQVFKTFFANNPIEDFKMNHKGTSEKGSKYGIGIYTTKKKELSCYFYFKPKSGGSLALSEVRIEED